MRLIDSVFLLNTGALIFFIFQSIILSLSFSEIEKDIDKMSSNEKLLNEIRKEISAIPSYNLSDSLFVIFDKIKSDYLEILTFEANDYVCEANFENNKIKCREVGEFLQPQIENDLISEFSQKKVIFQKFYKNKWYLSIPLSSQNNLKALVIFSKHTIFENNLIAVIEILLPQINVIYDNYSYFWNLENINKNLETIIDQRSQLIHKQKDKLLFSTVDLDEKVEELNVSAMIVDDLNEDLLSKKEEIETTKQVLIIQKEKIESHKEVLENQKNNIASSIRYAVKIQNTLFKQNTDIFQNFYEFSSPKNTISGDFWTSFVLQNKTFVVLIDATGHDVTSTFLNFLLFSAIEDVINNKNDQNYSTNFLIKKIEQTYLQTLKNNKTDVLNNNTFDIGIISYDNKTTSLQFSGANIHVSIARKGEIINLMPDYFSICNNDTEKIITMQKILALIQPKIFISK